MGPRDLSVNKVPANSLLPLFLYPFSFSQPEILFFGRSLTLITLFGKNCHDCTYSNPGP
ncbi:hypothetical protein Lepto7375DRAFT_0683 [Leptolyngbya sp. PCC 7375]|nr:hypothetical protein Lepto7375DRAFT_0683 [Leptolyngbya sp. PCC 7375]